MTIWKVKHLYWINYGPIYYISFLFGVLPFKCELKYFYASGCGTESAFSKSSIGKFLLLLFLVCNLYTGFYILKNSINAALKYESCFDEVCDINLCRNVCAHFIILWMNYVANLVSSVTIIFVRPQRTLRCLNDAYRILRMKMYEEEFQPAAWSVVIFMGIHCFSFTLHWKNAEYSLAFISNYLPLYITQCLPLVTENMISVLLLITQISYAVINERICAFQSRRYFLYNEEDSMKDSLKQLKKYYWEVTDLASQMSACFGLDFFFAGVCSTIRLIYFLFLTLKYMAEQKVINETGGLVLPSYQSIVFFVAVVGKFYYLCYRCDRVVAEAKKIIPNLHALRNKLRNTIYADNEQQVEEFLDYVKCRDVSFSACGFFTLNLHLICTVFGLTLTYFIVLMQFQASQQTWQSSA